MDFIKKNKYGFLFFNRLKKSMGGGTVKFINYRKHFPWVFDSKLRRFGFTKNDFRYFHFYPFFVPAHLIFPKFFLKYGLKMEKFSATRLGFLGSGYIVKARKI
jgi:hypothetical protein